MPGSKLAAVASWFDSKSLNSDFKRHLIGMVWLPSANDNLRSKDVSSLRRITLTALFGNIKLQVLAAVLPNDSFRLPINFTLAFTFFNLILHFAIKLRGLLAVCFILVDLIFESLGHILCLVRSYDLRFDLNLLVVVFGGGRRITVAR